MPFVTMSSEELCGILLGRGARLVSRQEHGAFLTIRRRLVFLPRAAVVGSLALADILRAAAITPAQLDEALGAQRAATTPPPAPAPLRVVA